ncbi:hypothetical protein CMK11_08590 [Candidatus Poribacteria bacterium]|nr:hypothetical protein [Candidatus Poribacteria bacterium]
MLADLEEREEHIMRERFGVGREDGEEQNLRSIGEDLGISGERTRQIEAEAMEALRHAYAPGTPPVAKPVKRAAKKKRKATRRAAKKVAGHEASQLNLFG